MLKRLTTIILALIWTLPFVAKGKSLNLYLENFPPHNYAENNQLKGVNTDIVNLLCSRAGIVCKMSLVPWNRGYNLALTKDNAGVFSTAYSPERRDLFKWVGPLYTSETKLFRLKSRPEITYSEYYQFRGYSVAWVRGSVTKQVMLDKNLVEENSFIEFSYLEEYLPLFFSGKIDLISGSEHTLAYTLEELGYSLEQLEPVYVLGDNQYGYYLALNKQVDDTVVEALNAQLASLKEGTEYQTIIRRYVKSDNSSN